MDKRFAEQRAIVIGAGIGGLATADAEGERRGHRGRTQHQAKGQDDDLVGDAHEAQAHGGGGDRNSIPHYDFPSWRIESNRLTTMPIRTSALRTLGGQGNVFAIESVLDEIATARGEDPVAFRLRHQLRGALVFQVSAQPA